MGVKLKWTGYKWLKVRLTSAWRCLFYPHYVLVCWKKCPDGEVDFKISHKRAELSEAIHRLKVDAVEILQDICDQNSAVDQTNALLYGNP